MLTLKLLLYLPILTDCYTALALQKLTTKIPRCYITPPYINNRYTYQSCWNVFLRGKFLEAASNLSISFNFKVISFVMTYNNKKDGAIFGCHITFLCHNPGPLILHIPNIQKYLDLILSILCVSEISETQAKRRNYSVFHKVNGHLLLSRKLI